jgi:hypothetical protein
MAGKMVPASQGKSLVSFPQVCRGRTRSWTEPEHTLRPFFASLRFADYAPEQIVSLANGRLLGWRTNASCFCKKRGGCIRPSAPILPSCSMTASCAPGTAGAESASVGVFAFAAMRCFCVLMESSAGRYFHRLRIRSVSTTASAQSSLILFSGRATSKRSQLSPPSTERNRSRSQAATNIPGFSGWAATTGL